MTKFFKCRNLLILPVLFTLLIGFTSCHQDDDDIYDHLINNTWLGDLGFVDRYNIPLESGITFKRNNFAFDEQYYYGNGGYYTTLNLSWWMDYGSLYLDYGSNYPLLEIRDIYITYDYFEGILYANGYREGRIRMEREY